MCSAYGNCSARRSRRCRPWGRSSWRCWSCSPRCGAPCASSRARRCATPERPRGTAVRPGRARRPTAGAGGRRGVARGGCRDNYGRAGAPEGLASGCAKREMRFRPSICIPRTRGASSSAATPSASSHGSRRFRALQRLRGHPRQPRRGPPGASPGTFVNGFHETCPIRHAEQAYGFARGRADDHQRSRREDHARLRRREPLVASTSPRCAVRAAARHARRRARAASCCWHTAVGQARCARSDRMVSFEREAPRDPASR